MPSSCGDDDSIGWVSQQVESLLCVNKFVECCTLVPTSPYIGL